MIATYSYEKNDPFCRMDLEQKLIDLDLFRKYLESLYIKKKTDQNRIISFYKLGAKEHKRKSYLEQSLNKLEYAEETINKITTYVINTSVRNEINKELEWEQKY